MTDEELVRRLRDPAFGTETSERLLMVAAADRIEELEQHVADLLVDLPCGCGYDNPTDVCMKHLPLVRKLNEQLEAARADAKEAETYAEELQGDLTELCRQLLAAEDKLAKAVEALKEALYFLKPTESDMEKKAGIYRIVTTLAEIESSEAVTLEGEKK